MLTPPSPEPGFRCSVCREWHAGTPRAFSFAEPSYEGCEADELGDGRLRMLIGIDGRRSYFVRGSLDLPVADGEPFRLGVWVSLSEPSRDAVVAALADGTAAGPYFGWLSNRASGYDDTLNLKTLVTIDVGGDVRVELEPTDHELAVEQRAGISVARADELVHRFLTA